MLVAAEPSGDVLGAGLAKALRARMGPGVRLVGVGGPQMAEQGVRSPFDISTLSVLGVVDAIKVYPEVRRRVREVLALALAERPDVAVLIDSWGFNLRVARALRARAPEVFIFKYVAPQVWATRPGRARTLARTVDHLLTIHSFDAGYFRAEGLRTTFVGNPALTRDLSGANASRCRAALGAEADDPILLLLPGSRAGEVSRLVHPFGEAAARLVAARPRLKVLLAAGDAVAGLLHESTKSWAVRPHIVQGEGARWDAMAAATVALACSGTVTTELARLGAPMVVAYRLGPVTYAVARRLIRTPYITLFNVAAGRFVAPELVQQACNGPNLAAQLARLLDDPTLREAQAREQAAALAAMEGGLADPFAAAAEVIVAQLTSKAA
jgi:lipid-A-disaccharide synthase